MRFRILLFILIILASGCASVEVCDEDYDSELIARFKTRHEGVPADTTVSSLTLYGIREGLSDSLLYDSISTADFIVPLDPQQDVSRFVVQLDTLSDTLVVYHERQFYMISYGCGFGTLFTLNDIGTSSGMIKMDSIINDMVDAEYETDEVHLWLYL